MIAGAPRIPPGAVLRPRLLDALADGAPLHVLRAAAGTGKSTLLAQWAAAQGPDRTVVWVGVDADVASRAGFWTRVVAELHRRRLVDDGTLYREVAAIADAPARIPESLRRTLGAVEGGVDLVLDGFGGPADPWDDISRDVIGLLAREPSVRCAVAGEAATLLEGPAAGAAVHTHVLRDEDLALTPAEARELVAAVGAPLLPDAVEALTREARQPVSELRHVLEALAGAPGPLSRREVEELLPEALRQDVAVRLGDAAALDGLGVLALAPAVDLDLAGRLVGEQEAPALLDLLERAGLGAWSRAASSASSVDRERAPVFRLRDPVRAAVAARFAADHPDRARAIRSELARRLAASGEDPASAVELALRAGDLDDAERLVMRVLPTLLEDPARLGGVLEALPVHRLRRHPFLAVLYALALNTSPERQARAAAALAAVGAAARARMPSTPRSERGVLYGLETALWRLLGQRARMLDTARRVVRELTEVREGPHGQGAPDLVAASALALSQAATSLLFGDDFAGARGAFDLLSTVAAEQGWGHYANVAASGRAVLDVLEGRMGAARVELASVDPAAWPDAWSEGYAGALGAVARAWVHLDDGDAAAAVRELDPLAPHLATIEHWEFIATARAVAQAMLGHAPDADAWLEQLERERVGPRTLPSVRRRLMASRSMLQLAGGSARQWPDRRPRGRAGAVAAAMQALVAAARGADADAVALLASAEPDVRSPLQQALVAVAGVSVAQRTSADLDAAPSGRRLAALATTQGLHWPVTLLAAQDRDRLLAALAGAGPETTQALAHAFATVPAIVDERLWRTAPVAVLTRRERDVLAVLARTGSRSEIAAELFVSLNTVKAQLRSLYAKLGARTRDEALERAIASGLLTGAPQDGAEGDERD